MTTRECPEHGPVPDEMRVRIEGELTDRELATRRCPIPTYHEEPCGEPLGPPLEWRAYNARQS
jgi:hypothetical protein